MSYLLDVKDIVAGYGAVTILRGVSIHLDKKESIGLFGPNGHGKTTLLHAISGLIKPRQGHVYFNEVDLSSVKPYKIVKMGLVHSPQGNTLFSAMGVGEILELSAFTKRAKENKTRNFEKVYTLFPRLAERKKQLAKTLSGGERQMLSIAAALMCSPEVLMLDEPTLGLSPLLKEEVCNAIAGIKATGIPLLIVEQDVGFLLSLVDRLYLIEQGEVVREMDKSNKLAHREIMDIYFGKVE